MDNFKTFLEDLASGRPAKKPVSSNLLKQRAKDNEKALKSGFMKMPDYVKKKFNEEEFKPHWMYKGDDKVYAKTKEDHDRLNKKGYDHDDPKTKKVEEGAMKRMVTDKEESKRLSASKGTFPGNDMATFKKKPKKFEGDNIKHQLRPKGVSAGEAGKRKLAKVAQGDKNRKLKEEKKNCGCGQDPCITYGKKQMKESTRDKYNPVISDVRNKEKAKKLGLPAGKGPLVSEEKQKGIDGKVCWKGYKRMGTKKKGGKTVDNCVKVEDFVLDAFENYYLTELSPKTISSYQKKAGKQYRDLKKSTPSRQGIENAYHQGYTSSKEYFKQHDDRDKLEKRGKGLAASKGKGVQKEDIRRGMPFVGTKDTPGGKGKVRNLTVLKNKGVPLDKLKPATNRAGNSAVKKEDKNWPRPYTKAERDEFLAKKKKANKEIADKNLKQAQGYNPGSLSSRLREASAAEVLKKRYASDHPDDNPHNQKRIANHRGMKTYKFHPGAKVTDGGEWSKKGKMAALKKQHKRRPEQYGITKEERMQIMVNLDMDESISNLVSRGLDKVRKSIKDAEKKTGYKVDPAKRNTPNPVSGDNIAKRLYGKSQKKRLTK